MSLCSVNLHYYQTTNLSLYHFSILTHHNIDVSSLRVLRQPALYNQSRDSLLSSIHSVTPTSMHTTTVTIVDNSRLRQITGAPGHVYCIVEPLGHTYIKTSLTLSSVKQHYYQGAALSLILLVTATCITKSIYYISHKCEQLAPAANHYNPTTLLAALYIGHSTRSLSQWTSKGKWTLSKQPFLKNDNSRSYQQSISHTCSSIDHAYR